MPHQGKDSFQWSGSNPGAKRLEAALKRGMAVCFPRFWQLLWQGTSVKLSSPARFGQRLNRALWFLHVSPNLSACVHVCVFFLRRFAWFFAAIVFQRWLWLLRQNRCVKLICWSMLFPYWSWGCQSLKSLLRWESPSLQKQDRCCGTDIGQSFPSRHHLVRGVAAVSHDDGPWDCAVWAPLGRWESALDSPFQSGPLHREHRRVSAQVPRLLRSLGAFGAWLVWRPRFGERHGVAGCKCSVRQRRTRTLILYFPKCQCKVWTRNCGALHPWPQEQTSVGLRSKFVGSPLNQKSLCLRQEPGTVWQLATGRERADVWCFCSSCSKQHAKLPPNTSFIPKVIESKHVQTHFSVEKSRSTDSITLLWGVSLSSREAVWGPPHLLHLGVPRGCLTEKGKSGGWILRSTELFYIMLYINIIVSCVYVIYTEK